MVAIQTDALLMLIQSNQRTIKNCQQQMATPIGRYFVDDYKLDIIKAEIEIREYENELRRRDANYQSVLS